MPETIFISYASKNSDKVDSIVTRLRALKNPDGTWRYRIWQDKNRDGDGIPPGADWWDSILNAIEVCSVFVFMISKESLESMNCKAELDYAYARNCHIIPIFLPEEFYYESGKYRLNYSLPEILNSLHGIFYDGDKGQTELQQKLADYVQSPSKPLSASRPPNPDDKKTYLQLYTEACDFAWQTQFEIALEKFRKLSKKTAHRYQVPAMKWVDILVLYHEIDQAALQSHTQPFAREMWQEYHVTHNGITFIDGGLFDPKNYKARYDGGAQPQTPPPNNTPVRTTFLSPMPQPVIETLPPPKIFTPPIPSFLPQPFEWCKIDGGNVTLKALSDGYLKQVTIVPVEEFFMAKYPTTNAQYQAFVDAADGYKNAEWWNYSEGAKAWRKANPQPAKTAFAGDDHPRTNVTWYESVAFTRWLSQKLNLNVFLPTDELWQRAAIGDKKWAYPYENEFDKNKCNSNTKGTTPVTQYLEGASPYGVMDMSGNVWEWCFTSYDKGNISLKDAVDVRKYVLRGGSWRSNDTDFLRADVRDGDTPDLRGSNRGFRFACSK